MNRRYLKQTSPVANAYNLLLYAMDQNPTEEAERLSGADRDGAEELAIMAAWCAAFMRCGDEDWQRETLAHLRAHAIAGDSLRR